MKKLTHIVTVWHEDGSIQALTIAKDDEYATLSHAVGGFIETVPLFNRYEGRACRAYCNENGIMEGQIPNWPATKAWRDILKKAGVLDPDGSGLFGPIAIIQTLPKPEDGGQPVKFVAKRREPKINTYGGLI